MLGKECVPEMPEKSVTQSSDTEHTVEELRSEVAMLEDKVTELQKQVTEYEQAAFRARLQKDMYDKASELIKKARALIWKFCPIERRLS